MTAQAGDTSFAKQTLRRELRARRLLLSATQRRRAAQAAASHALEFLARRRARCVALYLAYGSELSTAPLIEALHRAGITVAVPRTLTQQRMVFERLRADAPLRKRRHGIDEPARHDRRVLRAQFDVIIVPLLGFDRHGTRLGAGAGYYDRWLARPHAARKPLVLGYAYALQHVDALPRERWDVPLDAVITEQGMRWLTG